MTQGQRRGSRLMKKRYGWIAFTGLLLVILVGLVLQCLSLEKKLRHVEREEAGLRGKPESREGVSLLRSWDKVNLQRHGLSDPEEELIADLIQHKELIPYEGVIGGTMGFYTKKDIHILGSRWVLASFEDGHIGGHMLLEYRVDPGGTITWRVIEAYLD